MFNAAKAFKKLVVYYWPLKSRNAGITAGAGIAPIPRATSLWPGINHVHWLVALIALHGKKLPYLVPA